MSVTVYTLPTPSCNQTTAKGAPNQGEMIFQQNHKTHAHTHTVCGERFNLKCQDCWQAVGKVLKSRSVSSDLYKHTHIQAAETAVGLLD